MLVNSIAYLEAGFGKVTKHGDDGLFALTLGAGISSGTVTNDTVGNLFMSLLAVYPALQGSPSHPEKCERQP
jgi:hypothetical protein